METHTNGVGEMKTLPAKIDHSVIDWNDNELVKVIRNACAPDATDAEFSYLMLFCKSNGLNPAKKEAWFIKTRDGRVQIMTGINGYFAVANRHPAYDGMTEPDFELDKNGNIISCRVEVHRKDRKLPVVAKVYMAEFGKGSPIWKQMPRVMLSKVAKSVALREAFPQELGGTYTEEEMPAEFAAQPEARKPLPEATPAPRTVTPQGEIVNTETGEVVGDVRSRKEGPFVYLFPKEIPGVNLPKLKEQIKSNFGEACYDPEKFTFNVPRKLKNSAIDFDQFLIAVTPAQDVFGNDDINI